MYLNIFISVYFISHHKYYILIYLLYLNIFYGIQCVALQNCHSEKNCKCIEFKRANNDSFKPHKSSQHVLEFQVRFLPSLLFTGVMASGSTLRSNIFPHLFVFIFIFVFVVVFVFYLNFSHGN